MRLFYIFILWASLCSCTAYRHSYNIRDNQFEHDQLAALAPNDRVSLKLKTGQSLTGRVVSIAEDFMVVRVKSNRDQTIYFQQISKIKYHVNGLVTGLKIAGSIILAAIALLLLFPPNVGGPLLSI